MTDSNNQFSKRLDRMQMIREAWIEEMTLDETDASKIAMPEDLKERIFLANLLRDVDASELKRRKLSIEADDADTNRLVAEMTVEAVKQAQNQNPFRRAPDGSAIPIGNEEKLGGFEFEEGEKLQGTHIETVEDFQNRNGRI